MSSSKIIKSSFTALWKDKFNYLFFFFELIYFVGIIKQFETDEFLLVNFFLVAVLSLTKRKIYILSLIKIIFIATLLLIIPIITWGVVDVNVIIGFYIRIITGYLIVIFFGSKFYTIFENIVFILALLSLPLFLIQIVHIQFFDLFKGFSEMVLNNERLNFGPGVLSGHRYLLVFNVNSWAESRNSGFAWEPAGFGALLVWAALINTFIFKTKLNLKLIVILFTALTTFSVGTYFALSIFFIFFFLRAGAKKSLGVSIAIIIVLYSVFSLDYFSNMTEFMTEKTQSYQESLEDNDYMSSSYSFRRNRAQGVFLGLSLIAKSPMGYGFSPDNAPDDINSANGFFNMIYKFGLFGGIIIVLLLYKNFYILNSLSSNPKRGKYLFALIFIITFNGNPFYNQPFFLALLLSGYLILLKNKSRNLPRAVHKKV